MQVLKTALLLQYDNNIRSDKTISVFSKDVLKLIFWAIAFKVNPSVVIFLEWIGLIAARSKN